MTFEVELDGRARVVAVEHIGEGRFRVTVDGAPRVVNAVRSAEYGLSLVFDDPANPEDGRSREVQVTPAAESGEVLVSIDGRVVGVTVNGRRSRKSRGDSRGAPAGEQTVVAPMPGRIVRVLVGPGDEVAARQSVVVVEAMKMENELRAPRAGRVREVAVSAGALVEAGRALVVIE